MFDLLVMGDCNPDLLLVGGDVVPEFGQREKLVETGRLLTVGGSASIFACGAARLGLAAALVAAVGSDAFGSLMLEAVAERGVDVGLHGRAGSRHRHHGRPGAGRRPRDADGVGAIPLLTAAMVPAALVALRAAPAHRVVLPP